MESSPGSCRGISAEAYPFSLEETTPSLGEEVLPFDKLRMRREVLVTGRPRGAGHGMSLMMF